MWMACRKISKTWHLITEPFTAAIPSTSLVDGGGSLRAQLEKETWFHGAISRKEAEALLKHVGLLLLLVAFAFIQSYNCL